MNNLSNSVSFWKKRAPLVLGAVLAVGLSGFALLWSPEATVASELFVSAPEAAGDRPSVTLTGARQAGNERELQRLRDELERKDRLLDERDSVEQLQLRLQEAQNDKVAQLHELYEERMFAEMDEGAATRLRTRLERIVVDTIPLALNPEMLCGTTMCRIAVETDMVGASNAFEATAVEVKGLFEGTRVLPGEAGESYLYLAENGESFAPEAVEANESEGSDARAPRENKAFDRTVEAATQSDESVVIEIPRDGDPVIEKADRPKADVAVDHQEVNEEDKK